MRDYTKEYADLAQTYKQATARAASADEKARLKALYDQAVSDVALEQQMEADERKRTAPAAQPRKLTGMEEAKGLGRALAQGATFGFGEEIESLPYAIPGGETAAQARQRIRGEMKQYREARPGVALGAEVAGAAIPAYFTGGATAPLSEASLATRAASAVGRSAVIQGALSGAGAAEGGIPARLAGGTVGAVTGGTIGKVGGALAAKGGRAIERVRQGGPPRPDVGIAAATRMAERAGITDLPTAIQQAAETAPAETRLMDVLGTPGRRLASGIRLAGGRPGQVVEETMEQRLAEAPSRLRKGLYGARVQENIIDELEQSIKRGAEESRPFYQAFEQEPQKAIPEVDAVLRTPFGKEAMDRARRNAANEGRQFIEPAVPEQAGPILDAMGNPIMQKAKPAKYNPQSLDDIKKAMDDIIYEGRGAGVQAGQGGIKPREIGVAKSLRTDLVNAIDTAYPDTYAEARAIWGGEAGFRNAIDDGRELAKASASISPEEIAKQMRGYDVGDIGGLQRGYVDEMRQRIESGKLSYREINTEHFAKRMNAILGPDEGQRVVDAMRAESRLVGSARAVSGGSQTAERQQDLIEIEGMPFSGRAIRATGEKIRTAARAADVIESRIRAGLSEQRRGQVARTLMTRAQEAEPIISALNREAAAFRRGEQARRVVGMPLSRLIAGRTVGAFNSQQ